MNPQITHAKLIDTFVLTHSVSIYVPSTKDANKTATQEEINAIVNHVASELSTINGGATITTGQGCWMSDTHGLIIENVTIITSACLNLDKQESFYDLALWVKNEMSQEAATLIIDSEYYFVS